jgi:hypothetical protein
MTNPQTASGAFTVFAGKAPFFFYRAVAASVSTSSNPRAAHARALWLQRKKRLDDKERGNIKSKNQLNQVNIRTI